MQDDDLIGPPPPGVSLERWRAEMIDEALKIAMHNAAFRHDTGASEAFRMARDILERRVLRDR
jgi:hypothetical protein